MPFARFAVVHLLQYLNLLYEADEEENAELCLFSIVCIACFFFFLGKIWFRK